MTDHFVEWAWRGYQDGQINLGGYVEMIGKEYNFRLLIHGAGKFDGDGFLRAALGKIGPV